jgi:hypothetical protein
MKRTLFIMMALFAITFQGLHAQAPMKIVTNHPDFKINVKRCTASGKTVIIDLVLTNEGATDVEEILGWGGGRGSEAYDNDGNIYQGGAIKVRVANRPNYSDYNSNTFKIPVDVPMQYSICIENVPVSTESIARLSLHFDCRQWGLNDNKMVKISNIPISRD